MITSEFRMEWLLYLKYFKTLMLLGGVVVFVLFLEAGYRFGLGYLRTGYLVGPGINSTTIPPLCCLGLKPRASWILGMLGSPS